MTTNQQKNKNGDLELWWIPQIPMKCFRVRVESVDQALFLLTVLGDYDIFQFENRIKPDYCNVGGLEVFVDGEWEEWESPNGDTASELRREYVR